MSRELEMDIVRRRNVDVGVQSTASSDGRPLIVSLKAKYQPECKHGTVSRTGTYRLALLQPALVSLLGVLVIDRILRFELSRLIQVGSEW
jgi:hypothetical protein